MMQFSHSPLEDWARATLLPLKWLLPSKQNAPNSNMQHGNVNNQGRIQGEGAGGAHSPLG